MDNQKKKIFVIGHPCLDIIHKGDEEIEEVGGIIYSLMGFYLVNNDFSIIPIFNLDDSIFDKYMKELKIVNVDVKYIKKQNEDINRVHLFFERDKLLFECYQKKAKKINLDILDNDELFNSNIYINMISGFELELDDLIKLRKLCNGNIYLDFHTLTRGDSEDGKRFFRPLDNWREWVKCCDVIQLNEMERENLTAEKFTEVEFANKCLKLGCKIVNITKSEKGAVSYYDIADIKTLKSNPKIDYEKKSVIGCGDIFGATFFYYYNLGKEIEYCLNKAVEKSSLRTKYFSINEVIANKIEFLDE